jgi:CheY-like chemotaxis protein
VLVEHAASAEALCEQLRTLGAQAQAAASGDQLLALAEKLGPGPVAVLARYPFENPSWRAALASLRERAGVSLFLLSILQDRVDAEREASGWAGLITWPVRRAALRDVLGPLVGATKNVGPRRGPVLTDEQRTARARYRLLLAEDYELNQKLAVRLLERVGYRCDVVENGAQALAALETEAYDLVLMDCQMPEMDGFEATRRIRARETERGGHVPIVAMTANAMKGDRERCLAVGMDDYLSKPIHVEALYEVLEKYLP